jgi:hypothetical protein
MAHARPLPLTSAMALTLAAGVFTAQEHTRSHAAAEVLPTLSAVHGVGPSAGSERCTETRVVPQDATRHAGATRSPAVGSRALTGSDEEETATDGSPCRSAAEHD